MSAAAAVESLLRGDDLERIQDIVLETDDTAELLTLEIVGKNGARRFFQFSPEYGGLGCGERSYDEQGRLGREVSEIKFDRIGEQWFPISGIERTYRLSTGELLTEERYSVEAIERDPAKIPSDLFSMEIPANAAVLDRDTGQWRRDPEAIAEEIRKITRPTPLRTWLIVANVVVLAALGVYVYVRTRKA